MTKLKIEIEEVEDGFKVKFSGGWGRGSGETVAENVESLKKRIKKKLDEKFGESV